MSGTTVTQAMTTLQCETDGTYSSGTTSQIDELACNFVGCNPPAMSLCTTCDITTIQPTGLPNGQSFTFAEQAAAGDCKMTQITRQRTDNQVCTEVSISGTTPTGLAVLGTSTGISATEAMATLTCQADGTYTSGTATKISALTCNFVGCNPPAASLCTTCDINTIAPTASTGAMFSSVETAAAGQCKVTEVKCERTDDQVCSSISITGTTASGPVELGSSNTAGTTSATTTLTCQADGTYSSGTATKITQLTCNYVCAPSLPCSMRDISTIQPTSPVGYEFTVVESATPGDCKMTDVTCKRTDGSVCSTTAVMATHPMGSTALSTENGNEASARLICEASVLYSSGATTDISQLTCEFTNCVVPCETCDINTIAPTASTGAMFSSVCSFPIVSERAAGQCKVTEVKCERTDGQICSSISITGTTPSGPVTLGSSNTIGTTSATATLTCQVDGTYSSGTATEISQLQCNYDCAPPLPCSMCDLSAIQPTSPVGYKITVVSRGLPGNCKIDDITCIRTDGLVCATTSIRADHFLGTATLASSTGSQASTTIICQSSLLYSSGATTDILELACQFTSCSLPCETCDINTIAPIATTGAMFSSVETAAVGQCKVTEVKCERTDGQICSSISITGTTASGPVTLGSSNTAGTISATATLTCQVDGKYSSGTATEISQLQCNYNCAPPRPCSMCDITTIQPTSPVGYEITVVSRGLPGNCKIDDVTCKRNDGQVCATTAIRATHPFGTATLASSTGNQATATVICQSSLMYSSGATIGISQLTCQFTNCVAPCTTCNIATIQPTGLTPGHEFSFVETGAAGACKQTQITCKRTDNYVCSQISIQATSPTDNDIISVVTGSGVTEATATLTCQADGTYSADMFTNIEKLECNNVCVPPTPSCSSCFIPIPALPSGKSLLVDELAAPGACKRTRVTCQSDSGTCAQIDLSSLSDFGPFVLTDYDLESQAAIFECQPNGLYSFSGLTTGIHNFMCRFDC